MLQWHDREPAINCRLYYIVTRGIESLHAQIMMYFSQKKCKRIKAKLIEELPEHIIMGCQGSRLRHGHRLSKCVLNVA